MYDINTSISHGFQVLARAVQRFSKPMVFRNGCEKTMFGGSNPPPCENGLLSGKSDRRFVCNFELQNQKMEEK